MGFFGIMVAYMMRVCLSTVLTQLVLQREKNMTITEDFCPGDLPEPKSGGGIYDWDQDLQGLIIGAFYIGYCITHIPGGILSDIYGAKWVLLLGLLSTAIFTLLTPIIMYFSGAYGMICFRILVGAGEGTTFPALGGLIARWVPKVERGTIGALVLGGGQIGTVLGNVISGSLLGLYPWPVVFYTMGTLGVIYCILFVSSL